MVASVVDRKSRPRQPREPPTDHRLIELARPRCFDVVACHDRGKPDRTKQRVHPAFVERVRRPTHSLCAARRRPRVSFVRVESGVDSVALRDARLRMGLTQHELARLIDVAGGERISRWELGSSAPRPEMLQRLAQALNVGVAELLEAGGPVDLRRLRTSAGLSARALAARAHMSVPTYVRWESGRIKRIPAKQALKPLAKALTVTVDEVESAIVTARANASHDD
jgi:transcriptional regulator with XRE-family HTH domain